MQVTQWSLTAFEEGILQVRRRSTRQDRPQKDIILTDVIRKRVSEINENTMKEDEARDWLPLKHPIF